MSRLKKEGIRYSGEEESGVGIGDGGCTFFTKMLEIVCI